jgi:hypothetical protein
MSLFVASATGAERAEERKRPTRAKRVRRKDFGVAFMIMMR